MKENIIQIKSYRFSLAIVNVYMEITKERNEYVLSKQLLKSGTSIGANIEEAIGGQSKKDFFTKMSIAYKEARETIYWIHILIDSHFIDREKGQRLLNQCEEILKIIGKIQKTLKINLKL